MYDLDKHTNISLEWILSLFNQEKIENNIIRNTCNNIHYSLLEALKGYSPVGIRKQVVQKLGMY
jgi:hypothetical protein